MITDQKIIETTKAIYEENPDLFGGHGDALEGWFDTASDKGPEEIRQAAYHILDLLQKQPEAGEVFRDRLGMEAETFRSIRLSYDPAPGGPQPISAGAMMVCPSGECQCRRMLRMKGQRLFCHQCGSELVPAPPAPERQ